MRTRRAPVKRIRWKYRVVNNGQACIEAKGDGALCVLGPEDDEIHDFNLDPELAKRLVDLLNEYEWEAVDE